MAKIPGVEKPILPAMMADSMFWDTGVAVFGLVGGLLAFPGLFDGWRWQRAIGIALLVLITVFSVVKAVVRFRARRHIESTHELQGCLHTLHAILMSTAQPDQKLAIRLTMHRPIKEGAELEQVMEYVGDQRGPTPTAGRRFPVQSGIIGRAFRERVPLIAKRMNADRSKYVQELVTSWSYTEHHAQERDGDAMAWMGIPIADGNKEVLGILYADCTDPEFFTETQLNLAIVACQGIARYVGLRYK